jgi:hypothetical protein
VDDSAAARFAVLVEELRGEPGVTPPEPGARAFGGDALKVDGRIFAMLVRGELVVKLPAPRVAAEVAAGRGRAFEGSRGRPMKEWLVVADADVATWSSIVRAALAFVGGR